MVVVDHADCDQRECQTDRHECFEPETHAQGANACQNRGQEFDDRIAGRDFLLATAAAAAQQQVTDYWNILPGFNLFTAIWTGGSRDDEIERLFRKCRRFSFLQFLALLVPLTEHHDRQSIDYDVQKAADEQREQECDQYKDFR